VRFDVVDEAARTLAHLRECLHVALAAHDSDQADGDTLVASQVAQHFIELNSLLSPVERAETHISSAVSCNDYCGAKLILASEEH